MADRLAEIRAMQDKGCTIHCDRENVGWLIAEVERLKELWEGTVEDLHELNILHGKTLAEAKRLEEELKDATERCRVLADTWGDGRKVAHAEGMEAAAKDVHGCPWIQGPVIAEWLRKRIAAAHDKLEADANNAAFRDGGYGKETT